MIAMTLASGLIGASLGSDVILSLFLPSLLVAVLFTLYRIGKSYQKGSWRKTVNNLGPQLVHLGIVLLLVGYVFSSFTQVFQQLGRSAN
jgi:cytochrome c biogenesis factor